MLVSTLLQDVNGADPQNYLQGQDEAGQGERARIAGQLDRIENKVDRLVLDRPPPLPSKGQSPPGSPGSVSSTSTARPVTPPLMQDAVAQQLDDMRRLIGTVIGQNNDILQNRRSFDVDLPPTNPALRRLEDLLRRALHRLGDSDIMEEDGINKYPDHPDDRRSASGKGEGSWYEGGDSIYSSEFKSKYMGPEGSLSQEAHHELFGGPSPVPSELLDPYAASPDFDENFAMHNLPPETPPSDFAAPRTTLPPHLANHLRGQRPPPVHMSSKSESMYTEDAYPEEQTPSETPEDQRPIPVHPPQHDDDDMTTSYGEEEETPRGPVRQLPPPVPVDLPTPVQSQENIQMHGLPGQGPAVQPGYPGASGFAGLPPPPGVQGMARPSMPRIAGVRDPISTT